jgi:drug/metabolite transporter (DMT)-like permease
MARGIALLALLALVWGTNWPIMKVVLGTMPILTFRALCLGLSGPVVLAIARARGERIAIPRGAFLPLFAISFLGITVWFVLSALGITLMAAGRAAIIAYTMPILAVVPSWLLLGERPTLFSLLGLLLGAGALAALIAPAAAAIGAAPAGPLLMLCGAGFWAVGTVLVKRLRPPMSTLQFTGWQLVIGGAPIVVAALLHDGPAALAAIDATTWLLTAYVIAIPMTFGQFLWLKIIDLLPVTVATFGSLAVPVVGVLSSALFLDEQVHGTDVLALLLVVAALGLILHRKPDRAP